jgi:opacity protein-like surface antigen
LSNRYFVIAATLAATAAAPAIATAAAQPSARPATTAPTAAPAAQQLPTRAALQKNLDANFKAIDTNGDGVLSQAELAAAELKGQQARVTRYSLSALAVPRSRSKQQSAPPPKLKKARAAEHARASSLKKSPAAGQPPGSFSRQISGFTASWSPAWRARRARRR